MRAIDALIVPRKVSAKIQQEVFCACVEMSDALGVCRSSTQLICDKTGRGKATVEAALRILEVSGRIDRTTFFIRPGVSYRDIRTFPGYYNVGRQLQYCADREQYRFLRGAAEYKEPTFKDIMIERYREYYPEPEIDPPVRQ